MRSVYEGIAQGSTIETAVAETQRGLSRSGAHPIEWAGFVVLGASAPGPQVVAAGTTPL
jgi:CHAT domain-containing protein